MSKKGLDGLFLTIKSPGRERPMETNTSLCASLAAKKAANSTLAPSLQAAYPSLPAKAESSVISLLLLSR